MCRGLLSMAAIGAQRTSRMALGAASGFLPLVCIQVPLRRILLPTLLIVSPAPTHPEELPSPSGE
jgi:hypothetical protein